MRFTDADYPADPYPGCRPDASFVHVDGVGHRLVPVPRQRVGGLAPHAPSGYAVAQPGQDLDRWLVERDAPPLASRTSLLAYGSNACPEKLTWLREHLGLTGPVVALRARCTGLAAVWAAGVRARDRQRPVTLAAVPDAVEDHAVLLVTPDQLRVFDRCEGEGERYSRTVLPPGTVSVDGCWAAQEVHAYVGARWDRMPLVVAGRMLRAGEVSRDDPLLTRGVAASGHGLASSCGPERPIR